MSQTEPASTEPWITAEEAAEWLGIKLGTLYNKLSAGEKIPHRRLGSLYRFRRSDLSAWLESQEGTPAPEPATRTA